jgi:hypothetical protein
MRHRSQLVGSLLLLAASLVATATCAAERSPPGAARVVSTPADTPPSAEGFTGSLVGAELLPRHHTVLYGAMGWPDAIIGVQRGATSAFDWGGRVRLQFGRGLRVGGGGFGLGGNLRLRFARWRGWTFATVAEPELLFHGRPVNHPPLDGDDPNATVALQLGVPSVVADKRLKSDVRLALAAKVPFTIHMVPQAVWQTPVYAEASVEVRLQPRLMLLAQVATGADFYGPGGAGGAAFYAHTRLGLAWRM